MTVEILLPGRRGAIRLCPYCGAFYRVSNADWRRGDSAAVARDGRTLDDEHLIRCAGDKGMVEGVEATPPNKSGPDLKEWRTRTRVCPLCRRRYACANASYRRPGLVVRGMILDDVHRLRCARDQTLISRDEFVAVAKPTPGNFRGRQKPC